MGQIFKAAKGFMTGNYRETAEAVSSLVSGWKYFYETEIVVGITEETDAGRNASLLYQNEQGCPARNVPPRPVLGPALAQSDVKSKIDDLLKAAAQEALVNGNKEAALRNFEKAGMIGRDACKKFITDGDNLAPNAPRTIAMKGSSLPLVDTAEMLNAITYAVRKK